MSDLLNVTGLWMNKTKSGETYMSGSLGNVNVLIFKNKNKKTEKHPDYTLMFGPKQKRKAPTTDPYSPAPEADSEVPF